MHRVYLSLGSNLGDKQKNLSQAIEKIEKLIGAVVRQSAFYVSQPWGFVSQHEFVNAVVCCQTLLSPRELLAATQRIEQQLGRRHKSRKNADGKLALGATYSDRIIDIDILLYDDLRVDDPDLQIPHPLMRERDFVMQPLREILDVGEF